MIELLLCPECVTGKHENCDGIADYKDDDTTDRCECITGEHPYRRPVVPPNDPGILTEAFPELVEDDEWEATVRMRPDALIIRDLRDVEVQNIRGDWVPAVPLPIFHWFGVVECHCGKLRFGKIRYQEHYAYAHILGME